MSAVWAFKKSLARILFAFVRKSVPLAYAQDGLISLHSHAFMKDAGFERAYARGVAAIGGQDLYEWHWRIHVGLWAASIARHLPGDFVECGVNKGFLSSAIMQHLDWNSLDRDFYLLDTFSGLDERFVSSSERDRGVLDKNARQLRDGFYVAGVESVRENFAQWPRAKIIQGSVPDTLPEVKSERIAYLHLDMNCAPPEVAALKAFWGRLVPGAPILLDDYAYIGFDSQRLAMDEFARDHGVAICSLPTGQGLLMKPPGLRG